MSEEKFTKGPWTPVQHGEDIYTWTIRGNDSMENRSLAVVGVGCIDFVRDKANMHLICAAPEMYYALQDAANRLCGEPKIRDHYACESCAVKESCQVRKFYDILRKARGEA